MTDPTYTSEVHSGKGCIVVGCTCDYEPSILVTPQRRARCTYYGQSHRKQWSQMRVASPCGEADGSFICRCEKEIPPNHDALPWNEKLAFLRSTPDQPFDEYYCGCLGWD